MLITALSVEVKFKKDPNGDTCCSFSGLRDKEEFETISVYSKFVAKKIIALFIEDGVIDEIEKKALIEAIDHSSLVEKFCNKDKLSLAIREIDERISSLISQQSGYKKIEKGKATIIH